MATPITAPAGAAATPRIRLSVEPDQVGHLHDVVGALGVHHDDPVGVLGPEGRHVLGPEALVDRAVALPRAARWTALTSTSLEPAQGQPRVPDPMSSAP